MGRMSIPFPFCFKHLWISLGQTESRYWTFIILFILIQCYILLCHSVSLISSVDGDQLHLLAKINTKFETWLHFLVISSNGPLAVLHLLYAFKTMINNCHIVNCLGLFCITDLKYWMSKSFSQCWHTVCQIPDTHLLSLCVCFVLSWYCCLRTGKLNWVMVSWQHRDICWICWVMWHPL